MSLNTPGTNCRRHFLRSAFAASLVVAGSARAHHSPHSEPDDESWNEVGSDDNGLPLERRLNLVNDHTGEHLDIVYATRGMFIDESLQSIAHLMRDHRANKERAMDTKLLDLMFQIQSALAVDEPLHVLSGYRTPETNAALRKRSNGVARYSLHMEGKAADIHVPGVKTRTLQSTALELAAGGVGYYGRSGFVHVDTGAVRSWGG